MQLRPELQICHQKYLCQDCAEQFRSSWCRIFQGDPQTLLCTWHIDRAWLKKLNDLILSRNERITVYHHLQVLLEETDIETFNVLLQIFLTFLQINHPNFLQ